MVLIVFEQQSSSIAQRNKKISQQINTQYLLTWTIRCWFSFIKLSRHQEKYLETLVCLCLTHILSHTASLSLVLSHSHKHTHKHTQLRGNSGRSGAALPIEYLVQLAHVRVLVCVACVHVYVCFRARGANKHRSFRNPGEISEARGCEYAHSLTHTHTHTHTQTPTHTH